MIAGRKTGSPAGGDGKTRHGSGCPQLLQLCPSVEMDKEGSMPV